MSEQTFKLKNAPIVEAVLDIECDLPPGQQLSTLEARARDAFSDRYAKFRLQYLFEHQFEAKLNADPRISSSQAVQAFQFLHEDEKQLVQLRAQGYSFNRLAPYTSLDDYLPEIERTWRLYVELALPVQVRLIRLRYINRIPLPTVNNIANLDDYFVVGPHLPDESRLKFTGFVSQHMAVEVKTGNQVSTVFATQQMDGDRIPVIFDNTVAAPQSADPKDWSHIKAKILELRELKNHIFRKTLTEKCINIFQ